MWFISVPLLILILLVVGITVLVVKAGSVALRLTGMDEHRANFQAISAVTGTGFTTRESELVVADPVRRKIVSFLMIFGNVVVVMLISLLVGSFAAFARVDPAVARKSRDAWAGGWYTAAQLQAAPLSRKRRGAGPCMNRREKSSSKWPAGAIRSPSIARSFRTT